MERRQTCPLSKIYTFENGSVIFIGSIEDQQNEQLLKDNKIEFILSISDPGKIKTSKHSFIKNHKTLYFYDNGDSVLGSYIDDAYNYIDSCINLGANILIHCEFGRSRSVSITIMYLMAKIQRKFNDIYKLVKSKRTCANIIEEFMFQILDFEKGIGL